MTYHGKTVSAFSVDKTSANLGKRNSIKTRVMEHAASCYFVVCPCDAQPLPVRHLMLSKSEISFDVEVFCVDMFYCFDKSTNRKSALSDSCTFCDANYRGVFKLVNTRWLRFERAVKRNIDLFQGIKSYFKSN